MSGIMKPRKIEIVIMKRAQSCAEGRADEIRTYGSGFSRDSMEE
jgi:hypothetical protein